MRNTNQILTGLLALALAAFASPQGNGNGNGNGGGQGGVIPAYIATLPMQSLDAQEIADLEMMRQEEKVARDVYLFLGAVWGIQSFDNIAVSEQSHMDLVKLALDRYGLADPLADEELGTFRDPLFYSLFEGLVTYGLQSPQHALVVGALIEDFDIVDLQDALHRTDNLDIQVVWQNLYRGSRNHLRAFHDQLAAQGIVYRPIFMSLADYVAVTTSAHETVPVDENGDPLR